MRRSLTRNQLNALTIFFSFTFLVLFLIVFSTSSIAQNEHEIPVCIENRNSQRLVGETLKLSLTEKTILKSGKDIDYVQYWVGFGEKKNRVWMTGMYGPQATDGNPNKGWLAASTGITRRTWKSGEIEGVDIKGKLSNGNLWRFVGRYGEFVEYYDVSPEAAGFFDNIISGMCIAHR